MAKYIMNAYPRVWKAYCGGHVSDHTQSQSITVHADNYKDAKKKAEVYLRELPKYDYWDFEVKEIIID